MVGPEQFADFVQLFIDQQILVGTFYRVQDASVLELRESFLVDFQPLLNLCQVANHIADLLARFLYCLDDLVLEIIPLLYYCD